MDGRVIGNDVAYTVMVEQGYRFFVPIAGR
jgi:hypothetical protein